jgi:AraC-like DNA-binding protein
MFIARHGGDAAAIFQAADLCPEEDVLPLAAWVRALELAAFACNVDNFGLRYGLAGRPEVFGALGAAWVAAPTLGQAIGQLVALFPSHQQATSLLLTRDGGMCKLSYRILDGSIVERRQDAEAALGRLLGLLRVCLSSAWYPEEVHLEHPRPRVWREHEAAFGAPLYFGRPANALCFRSDLLAQPMPGANALLGRELRGQLLAAGAQGADVRLADQVRGHIRSMLPEGPPAIGQIAASMDMPRWTLQRRLANEGVVFSDLVDSVRRELAALYVRQLHVPITEIAELLGYSELSAFSRAFSRWFAASPRSVREAAALHADPGLARI